MTVIKWKKPFENGHSNTPTSYNAHFSGIMKDFFGDDFFTQEYASFVPAVNVSEEADKFNLELSAPGYEKTDFKIELNQRMLLVSAEHQAKEESNEKMYTRKEFIKGSFQRSFSLPEEVNEEKIEARYENGILKISLQKNKENNARSISIS
ncbi:MAG TPA: Hsp20/alpha crystallin family protein [Bacteroidia bacterium]|jgi:HSP20 family protein